MKLEIITPERILFSGDVTAVMLPGTNGRFTVLENHAPIISPLTSGTMSYTANGIEKVYNIEGGFAEVSRNVVTVCIEGL